MDTSHHKRSALGLILLAVLIALILTLLFTKKSLAPTEPIASNPKVPANNTSIQTTPKDTPVEKSSETPELQSYNKTVVHYSTSDSTVQGTAGIEYDAYDKNLHVIYNFYITDTLETVDGRYLYAGSISGAEENSSLRPSLLSTRYCNKDEVGTPFGHYYADVMRCNIHGGETQSFFITFDADFATYEDVLQIDTLQLFKANNQKQAFDAVTIQKNGVSSKEYKLITGKIEKM